MFIVGILSWWYGAGFRARFMRVYQQLLSVVDYFSIGLLLRTLFSPFRQISAGPVKGPLPVLLRAWVDRTLSRVIGAVVRTIVMIIGVAAIVLSVLMGVIMLLGWTVVPLLPLVGALLWIWGWVPVWN